ncbi:MAG: hypothetical protein AAF355_15500 [Myxococcota bacterium]
MELFRETFLDQVSPGWTFESAPYVDIDFYCNHFLVEEVVENKTINGVDREQIWDNIFFDYSKRETPDSLPKHVRDFRDYLESNPKRDPRRFSQPGYGDWRIRKACKGGIEWALQDGNRCHIHFLLQGIDQERVVRKNGMKDTGPGTFFLNVDKHDKLAEPYEIKSRNYTGSELRWIFPHRRDPRVQAKVQFWKRTGFRFQRDQRYRYVPCPPPWEKGPNVKYWRWYAQKRRDDGKPDVYV